VIVDALRSGGVPVTRVVAGGGLTRNRMLMQIYADVLGIEIEVAGASQACGLGAAMLGAVAAGRAAGGHASIEAAAAAMAPGPTERYQCDRAAHERYTELYRLYVELYDHFGRTNDLMHRLRALKQI
jgi:L-ribulokinase